MSAGRRCRETRRHNSARLGDSCYNIVMLTAPKNLSRRPRKMCSPARAKNRNCRSTASKRVSSTPCRSKRTCTYECFARLESCSRDPIGYAGSEWNLYEFLGSNPPARLDPSGMSFFWDDWPFNSVVCNNSSADVITWSTATGYRCLRSGQCTSALLDHGDYVYVNGTWHKDPGGEPKLIVTDTVVGHFECDCDGTDICCDPDTNCRYVTPPPPPWTPNPPPPGICD